MDRHGMPMEPDDERLWFIGLVVVLVLGGALLLAEGVWFRALVGVLVLSGILALAWSAS